jgi:hypothetical protein
VLRDIHLPPAGWWPPAPGWWLLAALLLFGAAGGAWLLWLRARRRPLRAALREIGILESSFARDGDVTWLVEAASRLLRRVARRIDPVAASRSGDAWRTFVHRHANDPGTRAILDELIDARFRARPELDVPALMAGLRAWCRVALRGRKPRAARLRTVAGEAASG